MQHGCCARPLLRLSGKCYAICHWKYLEIQAGIVGPEKSALCITSPARIDLTLGAPFHTRQELQHLVFKLVGQKPFEGLETLANL